MKRGEVYDVRSDPVEGSEQRGSRPVVVVSRDAINESSPIVSAAPCTTYRQGRRIYPSQVLVKAPEGGLDADSVVLGEQVRVLAAPQLRDSLRRPDTTGVPAVRFVNVPCENHAHSY
jgi:mRNA interferase MazF